MGAVDNAVPRRTVLVLVVALVAAVGLAAMIVAVSDHGTSHQTAAEQMVAVYPGGEVSLEDLSPDLRQLYLDVAADGEVFEQVRCYCGCEAMLDHRHLRDCFERPDGGWERHAVGCGICQVEARDVLAGRAAGTPVAEIIAGIDETYAGITEEDR